MGAWERAGLQRGAGRSGAAWEDAAGDETGAARAAALRLDVAARLAGVPPHATVLYQYRRCGAPVCHCRQDGRRHGPFAYAYWRDRAAKKMRSRYLGSERVIGRWRSAGEVAAWAAGDDDAADHAEHAFGASS